MAIIQLSKKIGNDLFLREAANQLFDFVEKHESISVTLDFSSVRTMSRSFAHQYLTRKIKKTKKIVEVNKSQNVNQMFEYVTRSAVRPTVIQTNKMEIEAL